MNAVAPLITFFLNGYFMTALGFGLLRSTDSLLLAMLIYFGPVFIWLYGLLALVSVKARFWSLVAVTIPWLVVDAHLIPQFGHEPKGVLLVLGCTGLLWALHVPGEFIARRIGRGDA